MRPGIAVLVLVAVIGAAVAALPTAPEIEKKLERKLEGTPGLMHLSLGVKFDRGHVVLTGTADTLEQVDSARDTAAKIRGVLSIDNRIEVRVTGRADETILGEIHRRFDDVPAIDNADIEPRVRGGIVTLTGSVDDARLRNKARVVVSRVEGVVAIVDEIEMPEATDEEILKGVQGLFGRNPRVPVPGEIEPSVEEGVVTLEGVVPRVHESLLAERLTRGITGVKDVVNRLEIRPRNVRIHEP